MQFSLKWTGAILKSGIQFSYYIHADSIYYMYLLSYLLQHKLILSGGFSNGYTWYKITWPELTERKFEGQFSVSKL